MLTRRNLLTGLGLGVLVAGFDPVGRVWAAEGPFERVPHLDGELVFDDVSTDNGQYVVRKPLAVLRPKSVSDIEKMILFCRKHRIKVATRGRGHSTHGQGLVAGLLIDSRTLNRIHAIGPDYADIDAGATWLDLTRAAYQKQLTPPVLTGYIGLSIGGVLSMGGVSSTNREGLIVDRVRELEVVTGEGRAVRCSHKQNRRLFEAVLAGVGQFGVITRAIVDLVPALPMARSYILSYADQQTFFKDLRTLLARNEIGDIFGQWLGGVPHIFAAATFDPVNPPNDAELLRGISGTVFQAVDLDHLTYVERVDTQVEGLRQSISWNELVKPWFDVWLPSSTVERYVNEVVPALTPRDVGAGGWVLLFPVQRAKLTRPMMRVPDDDWVFLFDILTASERPGPNPAFAKEMLARNNHLFDKARSLGGVRYPIGSIDFSQRDWVAHYGEQWPEVQRAKRMYDPDHILTPGPGIL
ncbi:FAD-binding protein [Kibdelosporangium philippinense]|uniref:FAD-binding protein n=1 Tax=Kibdelosporangium philippinense TaxID=211113 RepID=A0ABS8ZXD3_9PSEU|nr:FAD-binding protein [Kibdelosporangium philippinense]MCE7011133.1 FAD-binding protein [Kibdelosporangium philippinense]